MWKILTFEKMKPVNIWNKIKTKERPLLLGRLPDWMYIFDVVAASDSLIITAFSRAGVKCPNERPEDGMVGWGDGGRGGGGVLIDRCPWQRVKAGVKIKGLVTVVMCQGPLYLCTLFTFFAPVPFVPSLFVFRSFPSTDLIVWSVFLLRCRLRPSLTTLCMSCSFSVALTNTPPP